MKLCCYLESTSKKEAPLGGRMTHYLLYNLLNFFHFNLFVNCKVTNCQTHSSISSCFLNQNYDYLTKNHLRDVKHV